MLNKLYQDELAYLRELGREFGEKNPEAAGWLSQPGTDPDVERLLEGFAFLTARVRQRLDDELPELTHSLLDLLWPHYLRPIPSMTILQFAPKPQAAGKVQTVPHGAEVASAPVDGTPCVFRVAYDTPVASVSVAEAEAGGGAAPFIRLVLRVGKELGKLGLSTLRLHLAGPAATTRALHVALCRYTKRVLARALPGGERVTLEGAAARPVGLRPDEGLVPYPDTSLLGFRLLQEYFAFPQKFMFVDLTGLGGLAKLAGGQVELTFELTTLPHDMPPVTAANLLTNCAPAVNLFAHDADPVRLDRTRTEYAVRPSGNAEHFEVYSLDRVEGLRRGEAQARTYGPFLRLFRPEDDRSLLYRTRLRPAVAGPGTDVSITFIDPGEPATFGEETVSIGLTCTNRRLPCGLGVGDVSQSTTASPTFVTWKNLSAPTAPVPPPLESDLFFGLLSHLSLNVLSLRRAEPLRALLALYDFGARVDRQQQRALERKLEGLVAVRTSPSTRLRGGGLVRGARVELELDEERFGGEGELYLFGCVLDAFLGGWVSINAFSQLAVRGKKHGEVHEFPPRSGERAIL